MTSTRPRRGRLQGSLRDRDPRERIAVLREEEETPDVDPRPQRLEALRRLRRPRGCLARRESGALTALLGPSGSGKSTLLRIIAGLETADAGEILLGGKDATALAPQKRNVGFVFQHYAAFKHMTVRENVAFGLEGAQAAEGRDRRRASTSS